MTDARLVNLLVVAGIALNEAVEAVGYDEGLNLTAEEKAVKAREAKIAKYGAELADYVYGWDEIKAMNDEERDALYARISKVLDAGGYINGKRRINGKDVWDVVYRTYRIYDGVIDEEYYEENIDDFLAYQSRMGEPDFDWDFYSDWHKDIYGFRPR